MWAAVVDGKFALIIFGGCGNPREPNKHMGGVKDGIG